MRKLGVAGLGLLLIEVIAVGGDGLMPDSLTQALLLGYLTPVPVIVVVALVIDGRLRHR